MYKPASKNFRGLSFVEVLVSLVILGILFVMAISSLRISPQDGQSRGLAVELEGLFHQARAKATSSGEPVAIVFPTGVGTTPIVQECAILSGLDVGQVDRQLVFSGSYPGVGIFIGQWSPTNGQSFSVPVTRPSDEPARFDFSNWLPSSLAGNTAFAFLPSGEVVANGQTALDNEFPIVVASLIDTTGGNSTTPATLTGASDAFTVMLSTDSVCRLENEVHGGGVAGGSNDEASWALATLTIPSSGTTAAPVITSVEVLPAPIDTAFAASVGAECIIEAGGVVTLQAKATDSDGGPLFCEWTASSNAGGFSHVAETPMFYSPEEDAWVSTWHWKAPPASATVPNDIYTLSLTVRDQTANATVGTGIIDTPRILVIEPGSLVFNASLNLSSGVNSSHLYSVRYDGTDLKAVFQSASTAGFEGGANVSLDGRRILLGRDYGDVDLKLISLDGAEMKRIPVGGSSTQPYFSADGSSVYVSTGIFTSPSSWLHHHITFDSAGAPIVNSSVYPGPVAAWAPDGVRALIQDGTDIKICDPDGSVVQAGLAPSNSIALDWNTQGIFYGTNLTSTDPYPPGYFDIYQISNPTAVGDPWPPTPSHTLLGTYARASDIGNNGQTIFHAAGGIMSKDIATSVERVVIPAFFRPIPGGFEYGAFKGIDISQNTRNLASSR